MKDLSIWEQEAFFSPQDVVIVGAGFLGLWCALEIIKKNPQAKISILERAAIPFGASSRNAGFACFGSPTEMLSDAERMGEDKMWEIVEMRFKGIQKIRHHFTDNVIDYSNCGGFECFASQERELYDKMDWLNEGMKKITGTSNVFTWSNDKLLRFGFAGFSGMIENKMEGGLHSGKLLLQLSRKVQSLGVNILTGMEVMAFEKQNNYIDIVTRFARIQAGKLLVCTNAFSSNLIKDLCIEPARGQVLVTEPIENLKMRGTFHYDQGYYYFRNVGDRVLIGGARNTDFTAERTDELVVSEQIQIELERFVSNHLLPGIPYKVSHRWSGIMGFSENKLPVVREVEENVYAAISCNGMGVALSPVIAEQVSALIN